jgi:hypothetical protein
MTPMRTVDGELVGPDGAFDATAYRWPLRKYQRLALEAFEAERAAGRRRVYLGLPPGAGKTVLGLEIARRLGQRALVLCPNSAVQAQWLGQWRDFQPPTVPASGDATLTAPLSVLTYQALCSFDAEHEGLAEQALALWQQTLQEREGLDADAAADTIARLADAHPRQHRRELAGFRRRVRRLTAEGGTRAELLGFLHPNGRAVVERARLSGPYTLVLDECHHLLEMWGHLVRALIEELGDGTVVVGLTATPPDLLAERRAALYHDIFGQADFAVPTPAVVKEGDLAPYQELACFVRPLPHEQRYVAEQHERFQRLVMRLLDPDVASTSFVGWLRRRLDERRSRSGARIGWHAFEREHPELAQAGLRFLHAHGLPLPDDARLGERHRQPPTADDWALRSRTSPCAASRAAGPTRRPPGRRYAARCRRSATC